MSMASPRKSLFILSTFEDLGDPLPLGEEGHDEP